LGRKFKLKIDNSDLKNLFEKPMLNSRKTRWIEFLSEYEFNIKQSREKRIKWLMHSTEGCIKGMLQPLALLDLWFDPVSTLVL
jgi:hypothetical protein